MASRRLPCFLLLALAAGPLAPGGPAPLAPQVARMAPGAAQVFKAAFPGAGDAALVWSVDLVSGGDARSGTLARTGAGLRYTAPAAAGAHLVTAAAGQGRPMAWAAVLVGAAPADRPAQAGVSVKAPPYLAKGDGAADDTGAIQRAINAVAGTGGTVRIPAGTYRINTVASSNRGLVVAGAMTLAMAPGAILQALPTPSGNSTILSVAGASDVAVLGGTLAGDRDSHPGRDGEWGMGLSIQGSRRVRVAGVTARDCWGDGFYVSGSAEVNFDAVLAAHNRRNGLSITSCDGITVRGSVFRDSQGTPPGDGLDIEPNPDETVGGALITGCLFTGNAGCGLEVGVPDSNLGRAFITQPVVDGNVLVDNGLGPAYGGEQMGLRISNSPGAQVTRNILVGNGGMGIYVRYKSEGAAVTGNTVAFTRGDGIVQAATRGLRITGNRVLNNAGHGLLATHSTGATVTGNTVAGNGQSP